MHVQTLLKGTAVTVEVIKRNHYTVWVQLPDGNVIKRHIKKHKVEEI